ncbi:unnamed protein product, partial [Rotaria socialis]
ASKLFSSYVAAINWDILMLPAMPDETTQNPLQLIEQMTQNSATK